MRWLAACWGWGFLLSFASILFVVSTTFLAKALNVTTTGFTLPYAKYANSRTKFRLAQNNACLANFIFDRLRANIRTVCQGRTHDSNMISCEGTRSLGFT